MDRFAVIAHDHANDAMVHGITRGDGIDVYLRFCELVGQPGQSTGPIVQEDGELFGDLHNRLRVEIESSRLVPRRTITDEGREGEGEKPQIPKSKSQSPKNSKSRRDGLFIDREPPYPVFSFVFQRRGSVASDVS